MSNVSTTDNFEKELKRFKFDGIHSEQDAYLINGRFIAYEKGLLIIGLQPLKPVYTKYKDMNCAMLCEGETNKLIISLENKDGKIEAESKNLKELKEFYNLVSVQIEKYEYHDSLKELEVDLEDISIVMDRVLIIQITFFTCH